MTFKIGDAVEWTSQSGGCTRTKRGAVEEIVPAGVTPAPTSKNRHPGGFRFHESYLVRVKGKGLYWPRVSALAPAPSGQEGDAKP